MSSKLEITRLGAGGDGIADTPDGPVFVPCTLPGERVTASISGKRAKLQSIEAKSPDRIPPRCRHFGVCGGCSLQHAAKEVYNKFKYQRVAAALGKAGVAAMLNPMILCDPQTRRRAVFSARNTSSGTVLGFSEAASHAIVDIEECPVLVPAITDALPKLRELVALIGKTSEPVRIAAVLTESGLDVELLAAGAVTDACRRELAAKAIEQGLARISIDGEIIIERKKPAIFFGEAAVTPPPGGFLQATGQAEAAMAALVCGHLIKAKRVIDLFAGCGTFALRLAQSSMVHAVEQDQAALGALDRGFRFASGLKTVTHERRDLHRRPVTPLELKKYDGLVFDPPRSGADGQARAIAKSDIRYVAAVSCNPATLARDLATLIAGGYRLKNVTPIDQFLWTPHIEAVALLEKPVRRR